MYIHAWLNNTQLLFVLHCKQKKMCTKYLSENEIASFSVFC